MQSSIAGERNMKLGQYFSQAALISSLAVSCAAFAQERPAGFEPMTVAPDANGVDLTSGKITFPVPPLSVPAAPELSMTRIQEMVFYLTATRFIGISGEPQHNADLRVGAATSERFECPNDVCASKSGRDGGLLGGINPTNGAGLFTFTEGGTGRQIRYDQLASWATTPSPPAGGGGSTTGAYWASQIVQPDGVVLDIEYDVIIFSPKIRNLRPTKIKSNRGFQLHLAYASNTFPNVGWAIPASAAIYREGEFTAPIASVSYPAGSATDMAGNVWNGTFNNSLGIDSSTHAGVYRPPTNSIDQIVANSTAGDEKGALLTQLVKGGTETYNYAYSHAPGPYGGIGTNNPYVANRTITVTGPASYYRKVWISEGRKSNARITKEVDGLNRTILYATDIFGRVTKITMPEGNFVELVYDLRGNITQKKATPKTGSGLTVITESAAFSADPTCADNYWVTCYRPITTTDAKGNLTNYVWNSIGAPDKITRPAQSNGIRPEVRYEYIQRFAWYNNGSGTFVRSASGIWLKTRERTCKTTATVGNACAGGATDEVVTDYDYGPDSGPNYLLLRGMTVTATGTSGTLETLRTCFTYDAQGRKISETQPMGTGSTCP